MAEEAGQANPKLSDKTVGPVASEVVEIELARGLGLAEALEIQGVPPDELSIKIAD